MTIAVPTNTPFTFDRIAYAYDDFNNHAPEVSRAIGTNIVQLVGQGGLVLELGIGTGRIALPVAEAGCRVIGIDLALEMMSKARSKGMNDLLCADILELPLREASCDGVLVVHVLHHLRDWRHALEEAWRVLRPGGVILLGSDWLDPQSCVYQMRTALRQAVIELRPSIKPPGAGAQYAQFLARQGGLLEDDCIAASWYEQTSPTQLLHDMASRVHRETWVLDDELLAAALERVRAYAEQTWLDLDAPQQFERRFVLNLIRKPLMQF